MLLKNGLIFTGEGFCPGDIRVCGTKIETVSTGLSPAENEPVFELEGQKVLPGLIDIHTHGCGMRDFCDGTEEALDVLAAAYICHGITTVCPTAMTLPLERLEEIFTVYRCWAERPHRGARLIGINMEGPFLSIEKRGAHQARYIRPASYDGFLRLWKASGQRIKLVDVAPEVEGNLDFIRAASRLCTVSIAHTAGSYEEVLAGYDAGAVSTTHLFNAMTGLSHRAPGAVGAALDRKAYAELICDGEHVSPPVLRLAFRLLGEKIAVISDSIMAAGMPEGTTCTLGGETIQIRGGKAVLPDGTIAGSAVHLLEELRRLIAFGIPERDAIRSATLVPARIIGEEKTLGSLEPGKRADILVLTKDYHPRLVLRDGQVEFQNA